ncbi:MAG: hypothetical protein KF788_06565 [Piscinibacter sp.]|nr:hypothetical protein [Piscinibacter sp.]
MPFPNLLPRLRAALARRAAGAAALGALLALSGCGGGGPDAATADEPSTAALECERLAYPCDWSQVAPAVLDASDRLGGELAARLEAGSDTDAAAAWLQTQAVLAELQVDTRAIRFRLPGGRGVWVLADEGRPASPSFAAAGRSAPAAPRKQAQGVIRPGATGRKALLLAPFRYQGVEFAVDHVAARLGAIPGYTVTLRQNTTEGERSVWLDDFADFAGYDVIHVSSHGAELCRDRLTGQPIEPCRIGIDVGPATQPALDLAAAGRVGIELFVTRKGRRHLAVTPEFFRAVYPQGLDQRLVFIDACLGGDPALMASLGGAGGAVLGFSGIVYAEFAQWVGDALYELLGRGLSVQEAMLRLGDSLAQEDGTRLVGNGHDLRIRDLLEVSDLTGGQALSAAGSRVDALSRPGDGQPDRLRLALHVDGLAPDRLAGVELKVARDGQTLVQLPLAGSAQADGEDRLRFEFELPLGADTQPGETLALRFALALPEGGVTMLEVAPRVSDPSALPPEWLMTGLTTVQGVGSTTTKFAQVVWELAPGDDPSARYRYYRLKSGTLTISYTSDLNGCRTIWEVGLTIPPGAPNNQLKFDTVAGEFSAFGQAPGQVVHATGVCADGSTLPFATTAGGVYLYANDVPLTGTGSSGFSGVYHDGAALPTIIEYSFAPQR